MGISSYRKMTVLPYDEIHHIDMHMKLLDEETILVSQYPEGVADGPKIKQNIEYIKNTFKTPFGHDYDIKWIPAPASTTGAYPNTGGAYRTYTNAVIINKTILVPTYRPEVDEPALNIYKQLMPGYTVVGIDVVNSGEDLNSKNIEGPFPNPANNKVSFNLKNISGDINVSIHNVLGQKLSEQKLNSNNGSISFELNPKWNGVLLITLEGKFGKVTKKLIKKSDLN